SMGCRSRRFRSRLGSPRRAAFRSVTSLEDRHRKMHALCGRSSFCCRNNYGATTVRVALLSPFPVVRSGSDASVTMLPELVRRLSHHVDLHVIAPPPARGEEIANLGQATYVPLDSSNPGGIRDRLGWRPYWQASVWDRRAERSVSLHLKRIAPDLLHGEYLQVGGSTACAPCPALLTLHDVSTDVMKRSLIGSSL